MLIITHQAMDATKLRAFKYINDPKAFELVADYTRRRIIHLLRAKEMTVAMIAQQLGKTPPAIYYQINRLMEGGFVEVAREGRVDHFIETYYRATAEIFEFIHGGGTADYERAKAGAGLKALVSLGLSGGFDEETVQKIVGIQKEIGKIGRRPDLEERIAQFDAVDILTKQDVYKYAQLITMSDSEFEASLKLQRELRKLLRSNPAAGIRLSPGRRDVRTGGKT
jgi:DNA-binding transcriptional ArsR family regulator